MFKTGLFKKLGIILAVFLLVTGIVSALTLTNVVPTWSAITGTSGDPTCLVTQTVGNEVQVRYGDDDFTAGCPADTNLQSGFGFDGSTTGTFNSGIPFVIGEFTHYNNPVFATSLLASAQINLDITFGVPAYNGVFATTVRLDETANNLNTCPYGDTQPCADRITIDRQSYTFNDGTTNYQFEVLGFIPGTAGSCVYNNTLISSRFISDENAANSACLFGSLTAVQDAEMVITKTANVTQAAPGALVDYQIDYQCFSTTTVCRGVRITDFLPDSMTYVGSVGSTHTVQTTGTYSENNNSVQFVFVDPLAAGTTGYVRIRARVRDDGTVANNTLLENNAISTMTNGATSTSSNSITSVATSNWNVVKTGPSTVYISTDPPVTDTTYTVGICSDGSSVNLLNASMVDTLPAGAEFVSATGSYTYDSLTNTVTWNMGDLSAASGCNNRQVTVRYNTPTFTNGQNVTNVVNASGSPVGEPDWTDTASVTNPLVRLDPEPRASLAKSADRASYIIGAIAQFRLHPWNTGNVLLQNFTVTDTLPPELELVRITVGQYSNFGGQQVNIRYRTSADPLTWVNWPGGPFGTNQTLEVSALGLGSGVYIEAIQWQYGTVLPGFQPNSSANRPRLYARIINPDRDGNTVVDGISINNTAELSWDYPPGEDGEGNGNTSGVEPGSASLLVDVIPSPQFDKTSAGGVSSTWRFLIGQQVGYYVLTPNNNSGVALDEFTITDTIPPEFNVTGLTIGQYNNFDGQQVTIRYQSSGAPGVWVEWPGGPFDDNNQTLNVSALGLGGNSIIALQWDFGTVQPDFIPSNAPRIYGRITNPDRNGDPVNDNDPLSNTAVVGWSYDDNDDTLSDTQNDTIRQPVAEPAPQKSITSTGPYIPSSVVSFSLRVMARSNSPSVLVNPVVMDLLPDGLMYVPNSWAFNPGSSGATTPPIFEEIPNYNGTGRTLLRWSFTGAAAHDFPQNQPAYITFNTAITPGAPEGSLSNQYFISSPDIPIIGNTTDVDDLNGNSNSTDSLNGVTTNLTIDELVGLRSVKGVRGELDSDFSVYPDSGYTIPNGEVTYRLSIINEGNIPIQNVRVVDILPFVGDTGVQDLSGRQSQWRPLLTGLVSAPAGVTVYYSTSQNPCRPEIVSSGPAGCTAPNWSTLPPADITTVYSLRFDFSGILNPGSSFNFTWTMRAPGNAPEGEIAWNSFAFTSTNATTGYPLRPAEPNKVGIEIMLPEVAPLIELKKYTNGDDADFPTGPLVPVGDPVTWTYVITNTGNTRLIDVELTDDQIGPIICQEGAIPDLDIGDDFTCTFAGIATSGQYANIGTVSATAADVNDVPLNDPNTGNPLPPVTDTDPSHYIGYDPLLARLGDYVWIDTDGNGLQDVGEPGLPGVTVRLFDSGNMLVSTTSTNGSGQYYFLDLNAGDYYVEFDLPGVYEFTQQDQGGNDALDSDADPTTGRTILTNLTAGENDPDWDAGAVTLASIGNYVWVDSNNNGLQDGGESPRAGVTVRLLNGSGTVLQTTITDEDGIYRFIDLPSGTYAIEVVLPSGFMFSTQDTGSDDTIDSDVNSSGRTINTVLSAGENDPTWDAGLVPLASIGDRVWRDMDNDGIQDAGEAGVAGVTVTLFDGSNVQVGSPTVTNASGNYSFTGLAPGNYSVRVTLPSGYVFSPQNQGVNDSLDSDVDTTTGQAATTTLTPGENDMTWDAGLVPLASIGDRVWLDVNNNGSQDGGELGAAGVTVRLLDGSGNELQTTATDGNGDYSFTSLVPGQYAIEVVLPSGYVFSPANATGDTIDSDVNRTTGRTATTTLSPGENDMTWDAGLVLDASIGNYVWLDANDNGIQDGGESGFANVTVRLLDDSGTEVDSTTTDGNGLYLFDNLTPADYSLEFVLPSGYAPARRDQGGDDGLDSDPNRFTGQTIVTTLDPDENDLSWDMGLVQVASVGDRVWYDSNGNNVQDGGELGATGVTVRLLDSSGTTTLFTDTTDSNGIYGFNDLPPDDYIVEVVRPTGFIFSIADQGGDDTVDSDVNISSGRTTTITLSPNENDMTWDAGLIAIASVGNYVWRDIDNDGVQDGGETGVANVTVTLYTSAGVQVGSATTTNSSGNYSFTNLYPGDYYVVFTLPSGYVFSPQDSGSATDATDSDANTSTGRTATFTLDPGENDPDWDAGLVPLASIGDRVWHDLDADGVQDGGESGIQNVTVTLYNSSDVQVGSPTTTNASGNYSFTNLVPGDYYVVFTLPSGYNFSPQDSASATDTTDSDANTTTGRTATTTLIPDENDISWDAGLYQFASIGDRVWNDVNDNGIQDGGEVGFSNVTVTLYNGSGVQVGTPTTTDANGNYSFTSLVPGNYYVVFDLPSGYAFSRLDQGGNNNVDSDANRTTGRTATTTLTSGENDMSWDAGVMELASIGDRVWDDANDNGVQDGGESGVQNVTVTLYDGSGVQVGSPTTTDSNGNYLFSDLVPGTYSVGFTLPSGYAFSRLDQGGNDALDSDANRTTGRTITTTLSPGEDDMSWDAGIMQVASLGDRVWNDANDNGVQDGGESGVQNVTVTLYDGSGVQVGSATTTNASGNYSFTNLVPGDYYVVFTLPSGYAFSRLDQGGDDTTDSDANRSTGRTATTTLIPGENDTSWDAGIMQVASLGDRVWNDTNDNGVQDGGETGVQNVTVTLYDGTGAQVGTPTTTNSTGNYNFTNLVPGDYYVVFTLPTGYAFSRLDQGGNDTTDSDADRSTGQTITTTLIPGENDTSWDAGIMLLASIGDRVWHDLDADGVQDGGESGIQNVTVTLYDGSGVQVGTPTTTNASGNYSFTNLVPGDYYVVFTLPSGYNFSPQDSASATDTTDSDADIATGQTITTTLIPGENDTSWDAGLYQFASIGDRVWNDVNDNGIQDGAETGIQNVSVTLYNGSDVQVGSATTTDANGNYSFTNLVPGDYYVVFTLPTGYAFSRLDQGADDTADSDANRTTGRTITTTLTSGENDLTWDAGVMELASIGDRVWDDANDNGLQDGGESGFSNVTVTLYDGTGTQVGTPTTTDANGNYSFTNLVPGDYYIEFTLPSGYVFSRLDQGGDDTTDSDVNRTTGRTITTTLIPGEDDMSWDAGIMQVASLGDRVWDDANDNGLQDGGESGVQNVTVTLYDGTGAQVGSATTTNASGNYSFTNLVPGDYYVVFTLPSGYAFSRLDQGGDDTTDSDANRTTGRTVTTTLIPGENDTSWDAGIMLLASIGDRVWNDANDNGVQDGGETGVQNVTVTLYDGTGTQVGSPTTTNSTGNYSFTNLVPGDYYVVFTLPTGYAFSRLDQGGNDTTDSDADRSTGQAITTTLIPGENDTSWDAGIMLLASIGDRVWHDDNDNGVQDGGESGVQNVTVTLYDGTGTQVGSPTMTNASGNYSFTNLVPGDYYVVFTLPTGYVFSRQDQGGNDATDSDADRSTGQAITTTLIPGENDTSWDAGIMLLASIGDRVWHDDNDNGVQDGGENGVQNATVTLYDGTGTQVGSATTTDANGNYSFTNLVPGDYYVVFTLPTGYAFSRQDQGGNDTADSDADRSTGQTITTTLLADEDDLSWDAGIMLLSSIGDRVWLDVNANGVQDVSETTGIANVTVTLYDGTGTQVGSATTTDASGNYSFVNLVPGDYYVVFTLPSGYNFSPQDSASGTEATDSDANPTTGRAATTTLLPDEDDLSWDAGLYQYASLGDRVWEDLNADGIQDAGEPGVSGVTVTLRNVSTGTDTSTTTDSNGNYRFENLIPGDYYVTFTRPTGFLFTLIDQGGDDAADSDANVTTGQTTTTTLISGENDLSWDAGLYRTTALGDVVWEDMNANGVQDAGEPGVAGVTVNLYDGTSTLVDTQVTDANGGYLFVDLTPDNYTIEFILPTGYLFSPLDAGGNDATDSDADRTTGRTVTTTLISNEVDLTWDAGLYRLGSLGDYVWEDLNANGLQDVGERALANVNVSLYDGAGNLLATTLTDVDGLYLFDDLTPGQYQVAFELLNGYAFTFEASGADNTVDSNANRSTGRTPIIDLPSNADDMTWDAGMLILGSLGDFVWEDLNYNGLQDPGELGVQGVTVSLYGGGGNLIRTTTTNGSGKYLFDLLAAGDYYVEFTLPDGYGFSPVDEGADNAIDSDAEIEDGSIIGKTAVTFLNWGQTDLTWDAGIVRLGSLGDRVWLDNNRNGQQDSGEAGIPNVTLIIDWFNGKQQTTETGNNGIYLFDELPPGEYRVMVALDTLPAGLNATYDLDGNLDSIATVRLGAAEHIDTVDFGYARPVLADGTGTWVAPGVCARMCVDWTLYHTDQTGDWEIFRLDNRNGEMVSVNLSQGEDAEDMAPTRSPNAEWIVFSSNRDGNWELYLAPTNGDGSQIRRLTYNNVAVDTDPVWGPNNFVVFETTRNGNWDLYLMDMTTGKLTQLTDSEANDINAFWSPNGQKLVFQSDRSGKWQIYELDLRTLGVKRVSDGRGVDLDPAYNNAGDTIAFRSYREGNQSVIYTMTAEGRNIRAISDVAGDATNHSWSPDDSLIAYQSDLDGDLDVYVYGMNNGRTRKLTDNTIPDYAPTWQCGTLKVIFTSDVNGNPDIYDADALPINAPSLVVETEARQLTTDEGNDIYPVGAPLEENASREGQLPDVSEGLGEQSVFLQPDASTTVADQSSEDSQIWEPVSGCVTECVSWSVYQSNQSGRWNIYRLGEQAGNISRGQGDDLEPSRSPDTKWIAFSSNRDGNREIYIGSTDGRRQQRVTNNAAEDVDPVWSPNSQYIVYESNRNGNWDLYLLDVFTGVETRLTQDAADDVNAAWSSAGGSIVFQSNRSGLWQVYRLDLRTGVVTRLTNLSENALDPLFAPSGSLIAFRVEREGKSVLYLMQEDGSEPVAISDPAGNAMNQSWYYDDSLIAYQSDLDGDTDIYVYGVQSGETRKLTENAIPDYAPTWQCGEAVVVFTSDVTGDANIFEAPALPLEAVGIDVQAEATQLTRGRADDRFPVGTPSEENASRAGDE